MLSRLNFKRTHFTVGTDHDSLEGIPNLSSVSWIFAPWRLEHVELNFNVGYGGGVAYHAADALSTVLSDGEEKTELDGDLPRYNVENTLHR